MLIFLTLDLHCSAQKNNGRRANAVAAARGPQFGGERSRTLRQFGQDDLIGGGNEEEGEAQYNFAYEVDSEEGSQFSQSENAENGVISGEYRVNLPDGRLQIVRYLKCFKYTLESLVRTSCH